MSEPICEICSKPLEDDPPTRGYVMIHEECQGNNDDDTRYVIAGTIWPEDKHWEVTGD